MDTFEKTMDMDVYEVTPDTHFYIDGKEVEIGTSTHVAIEFMRVFGRNEWLIRFITKGETGSDMAFYSDEISGNRENGEMEFRNTIRSKYSNYHYIDPNEKVHVKKIIGLKLVEKQVPRRGGWSGPF